MEITTAKKRLKEITSVFIKYGMRDGIRNITNPLQIRLALEELGPTFVKIGQILSTRPDIVPESFVKEFQKLQDNVLCEDYEVIRNIIETSFNKPLEEIYKDFDSEPIACASMAVVHKAVLKTGEQVVVKIQRPNIREIMSQDIAILKRLSGFAKLTPQGNVFNMEEVVEELWNAVKQELDFLNEAANIEKFRETQRNVKCITCPKVYHEYTTLNILVIEYIKGIKIGDIAQLEQEEYDIEDIAKKLTNNYFKQIFEDGFFHADPHPGNIMIKNGQIAFIDFGMVGILSKSIREKFINFLFGAATRNIDVMTSSLLRIGVKKGKIDTKRLHSDIESIYNTYIDASLEDIELPQFMNDIFTTCKKNNISMPHDITIMLKGVITLEGVVLKLAPDLNIMEIAIPFVKSLMIKERNLEGDLLEQMENLYILSNSALKIPARFLELINSVIAGKLKVQIEHTNLDASIGELNKMANRLTFGVVVSALIIGSSLVIKVNAGPEILGVSRIGLIGFVGAAVLGMWLLISIIRSGKM